MATATDVQAASRQDENQLVTFHLGSEEFGFDIMSVQEIIRQPVLSRIPMAPSYVEGIANLRGMVLPVIDTRARFGMAREKDTDDTRVLVVDVDGVKTGLRVDRVRQVTRIQAEDVEPPPAVIRGSMRSDYLKAVVKLDAGRRIIMSLNPAALCSVDGEAGEGPAAADGHELAAASAEVSLADESGRGGDQSISQFVSFRLGEEEFAFPMERVREILRVERPSDVPDTPAYCLGILTVRGNILPVIDLRVLLGLEPLAGEIQASVLRFRDKMARQALATERAAGAHPALEVAEALRQWVAAFATSSQVLMETLSLLRVANDKFVRACQRSVDSGASATSAPREGEGTSPGEQVVNILDRLGEQIADNIREDQRLIVVQTDGTLLALLVDKVREVLHVPVRLIDPPPRLGATRHREMSGVARLNEGKRLVMLLDADNLVERGELDAWTSGETTTKGNPAEVDNPMLQQGSQAAARVLDERQFVTFRLDSGEYGIPINQIQEIDRLSTMTRIPNSAEYVDGVTNLRGEVIPVINARKRFGLPLQDADERTRVIIIDVGGKKTGLLVDSVREVLNLMARDIAAPPATISGGVERRYISGIGKVDNGRRMIVLLDVMQVVGEQLGN